jgi:hypothetical protein
VEEMGAVVPDLPFTGQADVTIKGTAKGKKSKTEAEDTLLLTVASPVL